MNGLLLILGIGILVYVQKWLRRVFEQAENSLDHFSEITTEDSLVANTSNVTYLDEFRQKKQKLSSEEPPTIA